MSHADPSDPRRLRIVTWTAAVWAFLYGLYRLYYALGGTVGVLGTPVSHSQWLTINAIASGLLFAAAAAPLALRSTWGSPRGRLARFALCWIIAVGCISHASIGIVQRISSLTGALTIPYPFWQTIDRSLADWQALFFNEPWFLTEGVERPRVDRRIEGVSPSPSLALERGRRDHVLLDHRAAQRVRGDRQDDRGLIEGRVERRTGVPSVTTRWRSRGAPYVGRAAPL